MNDETLRDPRPRPAPSALVARRGRARAWAVHAFAAALLSIPILLAMAGTASADDAVDPALGEMTETVAEVVDPVVDPIVEETTETVTEVVDPVVEETVETVTETVDPVVEETTATVTDVVDPVVEIVDPVVDETKPDIGADSPVSEPRARSSAGPAPWADEPSSRRLDATTGSSSPGRHGADTSGGWSEDRPVAAAAASSARGGGTENAPLRGTASSASTGAPPGETQAGTTVTPVILIAILAVSLRLLFPAMRSSLVRHVAGWNPAALALSVERPG